MHKDVHFNAVEKQQFRTQPSTCCQWFLEQKAAMQRKLVLPGMFCDPHALLVCRFPGPILILLGQRGIIKLTLPLALVHRLWQSGLSVRDSNGDIQNVSAVRPYLQLTITCYYCIHKVATSMGRYCKAEPFASTGACWLTDYDNTADLAQFKALIVRCWLLFRALQEDRAGVEWQCIQHM